MGEQQRAEAAAEQNADKRGNDRQLCAEEKARAEHQLDITAAEAAGHDERQKQHRYADDHAADQPRFYPQAGDKYVRSDAADKQQHRKPVVDFKRVHVHERHDRQNTEHGERQRRLCGLAAEGVCAGTGAQAAEHLDPEIPCGNFCTAAAAFAALQEITQAREQLRRRQRAPAHRTVTASLHHALSARQAPYHHSEKAEYARAQCEP